MEQHVSEAQHSVDKALLKLNRDIEEAELRRTEQIALIASLDEREREKAEAWQVLGMIEMTIRQALQSYALMKALSEPE